MQVIKSKKGTWKNIAIVLLLVTSIMLGALLLTQRSTGVQTTNDTPSNEVSKITRSVSGATEEEDVAAVVGQSVLLMKESIAAQPDGLEAAVISINEGDLSSLPEELTEMVRTPGSLAETANQVMAYQSILAVAKNIQDVNPSFGLVSGTNSTVLVDSEAGVAFVPLTVFTGNNNGFYLEWVLIDDSWVLNPYSLIQSSILAANLSESLSSPSSD